MSQALGAERHGEGMQSKDGEGRKSKSPRLATPFAAEKSTFTSCHVTCTLTVRQQLSTLLVTSAES